LGATAGTLLLPLLPPPCCILLFFEASPFFLPVGIEAKTAMNNISPKRKTEKYIIFLFFRWSLPIGSKCLSTLSRAPSNICRNAPPMPSVELRRRMRLYLPPSSFSECPSSSPPLRELR